jgi:hypothetical protein
MQTWAIGRVTARLGLRLMGNVPIEVTLHAELREQYIKIRVKLIQLAIASIGKSQRYIKTRVQEHR